MKTIGYIFFKIGFILSLLIILASPAHAQAYVIDYGSVWKYLDDGSDQGTAWRGIKFNDSQWPEGPAPLGYNEDQATTIDFGPDPANKYITYYFRQKFYISNAASATNINMEFMVDDGLIIYLNGNELSRLGLPDSVLLDSVNYLTTFEDADVGFWNGQPREETTVYNMSNASAVSFLQDGWNIIAVEVHQSEPGSSDIRFHLQVTVDGDVSVEEPPADPETILTRESVWKYPEVSEDLFTAWKEPYFDDSEWAEGAAQLGYGGKGEVTLIDYGPDPNNKYPAYYFRHHFIVNDPSSFGDSLNTTIHIDDGCVLYLNGTEVLRVNMPEGEITFQTLSAGDAIASSEFLPFSIDASNLVAGENVLAVSVHNFSVSSSDIQFDMDISKLITSVEPFGNAGLPAKYDLLPAYPNPFNPSTTIRFSIPQSSNVKLEIFDALGRLVSTLVDGNLQSGVHTYKWNAAGFTSGLYICRLTASNFVSSTKLLLMK